MIKNKQDGFLTGLFVGALAGVTGYLLLTTDNGKEFLKKVKSLWEDANKDTDLRKLTKEQKNFKSMVDEFFNWIENVDFDKIKPQRLKKQ